MNVTFRVKNEIPRGLTRHFYEMKSETFGGLVRTSVVKANAYRDLQINLVYYYSCELYAPIEPSGGAWAIRENSGARPMISRILQVFCQIMTPAPISLKRPDASYTSTCISWYLDNATARQSPLIPPPLFVCRTGVSRLSKEN